MQDSTQTTARQAEDAGRLLAEYLAERDARCTICRANLRGLTTAACPRCATPIRLTIDDRPPRFGWFLVLLAPFIVTWGYAFVIIVVLIVAEPPDFIAPYIVLCVAALDVVIATVLYAKHTALIEAPLRTQQKRAAIAWGSHVGTAVLTVAIMAIP